MNNYTHKYLGKRKTYKGGKAYYDVLNLKENKEYVVGKQVLKLLQDNNKIDMGGN